MMLMMEWNGSQWDAANCATFKSSHGTPHSPPQYGQLNDYTEVNDSEAHSDVRANLHFPMESHHVTDITSTTGRNSTLNFGRISSQKNGTMSSSEVGESDKLLALPSSSVPHPDNVVDKGSSPCASMSGPPLTQDLNATIPESPSLKRASTSSSAISQSSSTGNSTTAIDRSRQGRKTFSEEDRMSTSSSSAVTIIQEIYPAIQVDLTLPFPIKLHAILSHPQFQDAIEWLPHGRSWRIVNTSRLESQVIHKFFRSGKLSSFMRQVNGWAFTRIVDGPGINSYWHPMFLRGIPSLTYKMRRPPKVKNSAAAVRNIHSGGVVSESPNFERISKIAPLPLSFAFDAMTDGVIPVSDEEMMVPGPRRYSASNDDGSQFWNGPTEPTIFSEPSSFTNSMATDQFPELQEKMLGDFNDSQLNRFILRYDDDAIYNSNKHRDRTKADQAEHAMKLSSADIQYLAHQNRLLDEHGL